MSLISSHDPCIFGPDIAGLSPPTGLWGLVPDHEHTGKPSQACNCFASGQPSATAVLLRPTQAVEVFHAMASSLINIRTQIEQADASVILGLWRLPNDDVLLLAVDLEAKFAAHSLEQALAALPEPIIKSNIISSPAFDAAKVRQTPGISQELSGALKFFSN